LRFLACGIVHRGPDDVGFWVDRRQGFGLAHRRLSFIDLSPAGHLPMLSACGRYVIAFNGEIYNHSEIRNELEQRGLAPSWRGHADTEVLLAALINFGVDEALKRCVGMFAFALWDQAEGALVLARDRMGEKPLYYGTIGDTFLFASELKAFYRHPRWAGDIDRRALALMLRHNAIPAPYSIFKNVAKLPPATVLRLNASDRTPRLSCYWDARAVALRGQAEPFTGTPEDAVERCDALLRQSLKGQMIADVPLGAFLSGGIDSSTVVAVMQSLSQKPVRTFSIGFAEEDHNEAAYAEAIARHLGTHHTSTIVTPKEAMDVIPLLPALYDEPFSDSSQIPTFLVAHLARQHVAVSLSGDGGDELFSGYSRYALAQKIWPILSQAPFVARKAIAKLLLSTTPQRYNQVTKILSGLLTERYRPRDTGDKIHKFAGVMASPSIDDLYFSLISHWTDTPALVLEATEYPTPFLGAFSEIGIDDPVKAMMYFDQVGYLPNDILVKLDRASMGVSLESRVPFLDHRLVEFTWTLPLTVLRRYGTSKWPLRQILARHVPPKLTDRPKTGFSIPLGAWLRGPLRDWAEALLDESRLRQDGYFDPLPVRKAWDEHVSGARNRHYHLWDVLMFQAWLDRYSSDLKGSP
jgi:asparagine synthase (glutamine-hydrolysing)